MRGTTGTYPPTRLGSAAETPIHLYTFRVQTDPRWILLEEFWNSHTYKSIFAWQTFLFSLPLSPLFLSKITLYVSYQNQPGYSGETGQSLSQKEKNLILKKTL